jgi:hypothetical protein
VRNLVSSLLLRLFGRLRFPYLFTLAVALFLADLAIPDVIPLVDELLLGLLALLLGSLRERDKALPPGDPKG